ncbi:hypothetical protein, partial [Flavobacterium psychrophilum]|uniref:hypothetical protein n=1 Tax=Flavobacterium psychrophilum TaxID=96345 RepID=UPI003393C8BC
GFSRELALEENLAKRVMEEHRAKATMVFHRSRACGCCGLRRRVFSAKRKYNLKTIIPLNSAIATNVCWWLFFYLKW